MSVQAPTSVSPSAAPHAFVAPAPAPVEKEAPRSDRHVEPPPRLPSRPNLTRQFGEEPASDEYTVELPRRDTPSAGPTYSASGRAKGA